MMNFFLLILTVISVSAHAGAYLDDLTDKVEVPKDFLRSVGIGVTSVNSNSDFETTSGKSLLYFSPNVRAGWKFSLETKYIELAYTFTGGASSQQKGQQPSDFQDLRVNFFWRNFDVRLNYQHYEGAEVKESGKRVFYNDYEVKAYNGRVHYYFNPDYLRVIREGKDLVHKAAVHSGLSCTGSWFVGLNLDRRKIHLPENLDPVHLNRVTSKGITYDTTFDAVTGGPLAGGDGMIQIGTFFTRGKFGIGPAFLPGGNSIAQFEFALSAGIAFLKNHLVSVNADTYQIAFKDNDQKIANLNSQVNISYTYAF